MGHSNSVVESYDTKLDNIAHAKHKASISHCSFERVALLRFEYNKFGKYTTL